MIQTDGFAGVYNRLEGRGDLINGITSKNIYKQCDELTFGGLGPVKEYVNFYFPLEVV